MATLHRASRVRADSRAGLLSPHARGSHNTRQQRASSPSPSPSPRRTRLVGEPGGGGGAVVCLRGVDGECERLRPQFACAFLRCPVLLHRVALFAAVRSVVSGGAPGSGSCGSSGGVDCTARLRQEEERQGSGSSSGGGGGGGSSSSSSSSIIGGGGGSGSNGGGGGGGSSSSSDSSTSGNNDDNISVSSDNQSTLATSRCVLFSHTHAYAQ